MAENKSYREFYSKIQGEEWKVKVWVGSVGGDMMIQVTMRSIRKTWLNALVTDPKYLPHDILLRVLAGLRQEDRMPAWALADVLQELKTPELMCEVVRQSELSTLAQWYQGSDGNWHAC